MGRLKWSAVTGRWETAAGTDTPPAGYVQGDVYRDVVTGEQKVRRGAGEPDELVTRNPQTGQWNLADGSSPYVPRKATATKSPTTTQAPRTTQAPKAATTTATPKTTTAKPAGTQTRGGQGGVAPSAAQTNALRLGPTGAIVDPAVQENLQTPSDPATMALIEYFKSQAAINSGGGSGSKTDTPAELAAKYRANINAANIQQQAGATAQTEYNQIGQNAYNNAINTANPMFAQQTADTNAFYDAQLEAIKNYYNNQNTQASKTISDAGAAFMAGLPEATAFANAQVANLPQIQQGLGDALSAYGATGNKATEVSTQDAAYLDAIAKMQSSANAQLSNADKAYMTALRTAGQGANTAAQQALAGNLAGLQAQDTSGVNAARRTEVGNIIQNKAATTSDAEALRQQYLAKGIDALMSGRQTAAATKAQAAADYGVPKKAKSKKTTKK
jgi:hypothetical protein